MYTKTDYTHLLEKNAENTDEFSESTDADRWCRLLLVHSENLQSAVGLFDQHHDSGWDYEWLLQHHLTRMSTNASNSIHLSLKNYQYTTATRDARYLFEVLLILKGLNRSTEDTKQIAKRFHIQLEHVARVPHVDSTFPFDYIDSLGKLRQSEKDKLINQHDGVRGFYHLLSERASHPIRLDFVDADGQKSVGPQGDISELSLWLMSGIVEEYMRAIRGSNGSEETIERLHTIKDSIISNIDSRPPVFVDEYISESR